ncbi:IclR family transcriptional regulator [Rhodococcus phenolicus]|uniref:IclR family transcriptional regulator n=1 Tax=Rhodococcus phenolicus TaxID=263849 RepID=UPI00082EE260|nr:helix-turn-helix domain-containing protein [Rhodococcus phenolicus]
MTPRSGSQAVERAIAVLACFGGGEAEIGVSSLAVRTGLPVSTAHRIAQALVRGRMLERVPGGEGYRVGPGLFSLAVPPLMRLGVDHWAPDLYALAADIDLAASLGVARSGEVLSLFSARPPDGCCDTQIPRSSESIDDSVMGRAILAFGPAQPRPPALAAELELVRRRGYALEFRSERSSVLALAVPVFGTDRRPWGAVGVQAGRRRLTDRAVGEVVPAMQRAAARIGRRLPPASSVEKYSG